ncbi:hypothetical protein RRG08_013920 [Elysia crispata]|uniref:C-type lectin domain-containing protein n=1 Tax=Elysia crispata TaxID=231223 RepID=A0AAE1AZQ4_9GAST|nr:hypothetical protein RRG08_013920 [Elysia crispata]
MVIAATPKKVFVECIGRIISDTSFGTARKIYLEMKSIWKNGDKDSFAITGNIILLHNRKTLKVLQGNAKKMSYLKINRQMKVGFRAFQPKSGSMSIYMIIIFDYFVGMDGSQFLCSTVCKKGKEVLKRKIVQLTYPQGKCDIKRYQFEYPCKYSDYISLTESGACVKVIKLPMSWREASWRCQHHYNGTLIKIINKVLDDDIFDLIQKKRKKNYWIGLTSLKRKQLHLNGFSWFDETELASYFNWFHTRQSQFFPIKQENCVSKNSISGKWFIRDCYPTKLPFICQKVSARNPGPPSLVFNFTPGHKFAYIGYKLVAKCSAFTELGAAVKFRIEDAFNVTDIAHDMDYYGIKFTLEEDGRFTEMDDRCFPRTIATMTFELTTKLLGTNLSCCWGFQNNFTSCSDIKSTELRYLPRRPHLVIHSPYLLSKGEFLTATCTACVGTGGQLVWTLVRQEDQIQWSSQFAITQQVPVVLEVSSNQSEMASFVKGDNITRISWVASEDALCGPYIDSTFKRLVEGDLHGSVLTCLSSNPDKQTVTTADVTARSSVFSVSVYKSHVWNGLSEKKQLTLFFILMWLLPMALGVSLCLGLPLLRKKSNIPGTPTKGPREAFSYRHSNQARLHPEERKQDEGYAKPTFFPPENSSFGLKKTKPKTLTRPLRL